MTEILVGWLDKGGYAIFVISGPRVEEYYRDIDGEERFDQIVENLQLTPGGKVKIFRADRDDLGRIVNCVLL